MRYRIALVGLLVILVCLNLAAQQQARPPIIQENATVKISEHVYVIPDGGVTAVPNVGIIVGSRATLVVDTGLGPRNGQAVLREVAKVSKNSEMYVVSTHFHPEHAMGEPAFPSSAKLLRAQAQQQDIDEFGLSVVKTFSERSPVMAELLKDVQFRRADELFETEKILDLGGVRVRLLWMGPTHTRGDTLIFVEGDAVLFAGDVVMNRRFVSLTSPYSSVEAWLRSLNQIELLRPTKIVPSHGEMGDESLIRTNRDYLKSLQVRVRDLKAIWQPPEEVVEVLTREFQLRYPNWTGFGAIAAAVEVAYEEAPYSEAN